MKRAGARERVTGLRRISSLDIMVAAMSARTIYLRSYDLFNEILEYRLPDGEFAILNRRDFTAPGAALTIGAFTREGQHVAGVFASPAGPVLFLNSRHLVGRLGATSATVEPTPERLILQFTLTHEERIEFMIRYTERFGIGTNPYDNEPEDVDLFSMIAAGLRKEQFFRYYVKEWVVS